MRQIKQVLGWALLIIGCCVWAGIWVLVVLVIMPIAGLQEITKSTVATILLIALIALFLIYSRVNFDDKEAMRSDISGLNQQQREEVVARWKEYLNVVPQK